MRGARLVAFTSVGNNAQWAVAAKVEATGGRYHASMVLAIALKPRQNIIDLSDEVGGPRVNAMARTGNANHQRINAAVLQGLVVLLGLTHGRSVVLLAREQHCRR